MMEYKYAKKSFEIVWNDAGKFECSELGIVKDTPEEVKVEIRSQTEKEEKLPIVDVFFFDGYALVYGKTNLKSASTGRYRYYKNVWVSWKNKSGKNERRQIQDEKVYIATPENVAKINQVMKLKQQARTLEDQASEIRDTLESVVAIEI